MKETETLPIGNAWRHGVSDLFSSFDVSDLFCGKERFGRAQD